MQQKPNRISKAAIKTIASGTGIRLTDKAANAIARILEKRAKRIAKYAVTNAKRSGRKAVSEIDINKFRLEFGD
ncbi:MAG: hypothetical protein KGH98_01490 [Candidatus Micrarchaeota archaeon]|nr:hypothetical protein [Candidatus Micrarchaeota archaeon]